MTSRGPAFLLPLLLLAAACGAPGRRDPNMPSWVMRGSGIFKAADGSLAFYGRGVAAEVRTPALGWNISKERAREDILVIINAAMAAHAKTYLDSNYGKGDPAQGRRAVESGKDFVKFIHALASNADNYAAPGAGRYYSLFKLDIALVKEKLAASKELDPGLRDYLLANIDRSADLSFPLHREASEQDAPRAPAAEAKTAEASPSEWDPEGKNAFLHHLDLGLRLHYEGRYAESSRKLDAAEALARAVAARPRPAALDEAEQDYAGEAPDLTALAAFRALNDAFLGRPAAGEGWLAAAPVSPEAGEVVFLHYNGAAPRKVSARWPAAWREAMASLERARMDGDEQALKPKVDEALRAAVAVASITVATPEYAPPASAIASSEIRSADAGAETSLAEDLSGLAVRSLAARVAAARERVIAHAMITYLLAKAHDDAVAVKYGRGSWQYLLIQKTTNSMTETPEADVRAPRMLPAQIRLARLALTPGVHDLTVTYKDASGATMGRESYKGVTVVKGARTYLAARTSR